mgnify:CR=1 FL=1
MNRKQIHKKKILYRVFCVVLILLVAAAALMVIRKWEDRQGAYSDTDTESPSANRDDRRMVRYDGQWYSLKDNQELLLIMGLDKFEKNTSSESYNNDQQADFLILLAIDNNARTVEALHINRDSMAEINILGVGGQIVGTYVGQLALAHTYGSGDHDSCRNTLKAVSSLLYDLPIDHYVSVTMDAVQVANDMAGGVTVTVTDDFSGVDDTLKQGEQVRLLGQHALNYVRARSGVADGTNINRMERQRHYIGALYDAISQRSASDENFLLQLMFEIKDYIVSDCSAAKLNDIMNQITGYEVGDIQVIEGKTEAGEEYMEFYPDEKLLQKQIVTLFYEPSE